MALSASAVVSARLAPKLEEAELIRAVQQGDQSAFEALVRAYDQSVLGLAMNLLRSPEDARDAYQEAVTAGRKITLHRPMDGGQEIRLLS